jgi:hypothetical protein
LANSFILTVQRYEKIFIGIDFSKEKFDATILPQTAGTCDVSLTIGNGPTSTYSFVMPARTFEAGNRYIYNVTVKTNSP